MKWRWLLATWGVAVSLNACVLERGQTCTRQSECVLSISDGGTGTEPTAVGGQGQHCSNAGRCVAECRVDRDCPSGSVCAQSCGVCLGIGPTGNVVGRGTCFTAALPLGVLTSACAADLGDAEALVARVMRTGGAYQAPVGCRGLASDESPPADAGPADTGPADTGAVDTGPGNVDAGAKQDAVVVDGGA